MQLVVKIVHNYNSPEHILQSGQMCSFKNKLRQRERHKLAPEPANLRGSRVELQEMGDRLATLFEYSLSKCFKISIYN